MPLNQEVVESARFNRGGRALPGQLDKSGQVVGVVSKTLADMERTPSVKEVLDNYRKRGLEHVLATVQDWYTTSSKVDWSGAYTTVDGRTAMVLPIRTLLFPSMVEQTVHHELGHAVDLIEAGGLFSGLPEFNLRIVGDKVRAHGDVASELVQHFETDPASPMGSLLKYPLDRTKYGDLNAQAIREELFAQVWSVWNTPTGRDFIADNLPDTAYFMEKVDEEIRQDEYRAKVVALSANGGAPQAAGGTVRFGEGQAVLPTTAARGAGGGQSVLPGGRGQVADTPAFKRWFGDSKVVDSEGEPLVVYHGTSGNEGGDAFTYFDTYASNYGLMGQGAYFTDNPDVASSYTTKGKGDTPTVYKAFLSIQNPIDMDAKADSAKWQEQFDGIEEYHEGGGTNESWYRAAEDLLRDQALPGWPFTLPPCACPHAGGFVLPETGRR